METAAVESSWAGLSQRLGAWKLGGTIGEARSEGYRFTTYAASGKVCSGRLVDGFGG